MPGIHEELVALAGHLARARESLLLQWQSAIKRDPALSEGAALPRTELLDHIPALLVTFEQSLRQSGLDDPDPLPAQAPAAAHGLQRWQQGYHLSEVARELGKLNECLIGELDRYAASETVTLGAMAHARALWARLCSTSIEESVNQYFRLQQQEAAGHVRDLEQALEEIRELEQHRADVWQQAAHDLRGNLGVVANATTGLALHGKSDAVRDNFTRILSRNVASLHHFLDDLTSLARLQAGREVRQSRPLEVGPLLESLCEGIRPVAAQRGLFLKCESLAQLSVEGDAVKIRRIAQNLILNAVKYTSAGGVMVSWGDCAVNDPKRWMLAVRDTGPGFPSDSGKPISAALDPNSEPLPNGSARTDELHRRQEAELGERLEGGEGIGLSIVKRLCDLLDATIEVESKRGEGTTFVILFPRRYG